MISKISTIKFSKLIAMVSLGVLTIYSDVVLALDPISKASNKIESTLFGGLGISICSIIIGATFLMAKVGKITWDKFLFTAICSAGFLGSRSIVTIIQSCVS